jgi:hypothetical protein
MKAFLVAVLFWFPISLYRGFVLSKLWLWFVVPVFGSRAISVAQGAGLCMVVVFLTWATAFTKHVKFDNGVFREQTSAETVYDSCLF